MDACNIVHGSMRHVVNGTIRYKLLAPPSVLIVESYCVQLKLLLDEAVGDACAIGGRRDRRDSRGTYRSTPVKEGLRATCFGEPNRSSKAPGDHPGELTLRYIYGVDGARLGVPPAF